MTDTLDIYNQVKQHYQYMPDLNAGQLRVTESINITQDDYPQLEQRISDFKAESGWLSYQSKRVRYYAGDAFLTETEGFILQGELNHGLTSCHIWQNDSGGWLFTIISDVSAEQHNGFIEQVHFIAVPEHDDDKEQQLNYQVYWEPDEALGYRRVLSRFIGFSDKGDLS